MMLRACLDWRVLLALGTAGVGVALLAPGLLGAALPLLVVAACPVSMIVMMRAMGRGTQPAPGGTNGKPSLGRPDRVGALRAELTSLAARHDALRRELGALESGSEPGVRGDIAGVASRAAR